MQRRHAAPNVPCRKLDRGDLKSEELGSKGLRDAKLNEPVATMLFCLYH
jgi:hypothetical protein